jgi:hypothetical protein
MNMNCKITQYGMKKDFQTMRLKQQTVTASMNNTLKTKDICRQIEDLLSFKKINFFNKFNQLHTTPCIKLSSSGTSQYFLRIVISFKRESSAQQLQKLTTF